MLDGIKTISLVEQTGTPAPVLVIGGIALVVFVFYCIYKAIWKRKKRKSLGK